MFQGIHSEVWEDSKLNTKNTILIGDTPEKGALYKSRNVVILPSWPGYISAQPNLCDGLLSWLRKLSSSALLVIGKSLIEPKLAKQEATSKSLALFISYLQGLEVGTSSSTSRGNEEF